MQRAQTSVFRRPSCHNGLAADLYTVRTPGFGLTRGGGLHSKIIRNDLVIVVRRMRKDAAAVAVAQRPDSGHVRLQLIINDNVAALVGRNPGAVKIQIVRVRGTSHCEKNMCAYDFRRTSVAS